MAQLRAAAATVPTNLGALSGLLLDPLGLGDAVDGQAATPVADSAVFGAMHARFDGQAGAFAYLLFILLYFPCVATIAVIRRETGTAWAVFVASWTTSVAYITATVYYQAATYALHPQGSLAWILGLIGVLLAVVWGLRQWAQRGGRGRQAIDLA
jgi:ferrous iron transport protein B